VQGPDTIVLDVSELFKDAKPTTATWDHKGAVNELYALCLMPLTMDTFQSPVWLPFNSEDKTVRVRIPDGNHILYALVKIYGDFKSFYGLGVHDGPALNHLDKKPVQTYLNYISEHLFDKLTGVRKNFRAIFCDSMELFGSNWCCDFTDEFKRRKGYEIQPYLPLIVNKVTAYGDPAPLKEATRLSGQAAEEIERVRYDFIAVVRELTKERFLDTFHQWCHQHGFQSRAQTYGFQYHPLDTSMGVDIPECETWVSQAIWYNGGLNPDFVREPAFTNVNKFVSSAARLAGKKTVSCEEGSGGFIYNESLEHLKIMGDQSMLSGVTHSIMSSYGYSPPDLPFPGWAIFGTWFSERNPWWPYLHLWMAYKTRISALLQATVPYADIAVLHPLADMWSKYGAQFDPFPTIIYPEYQYRVWEAIHQNGNGCDYTSESVIQQSTSADEFLKYNSRKYHTVILIEVESMMPATADALSCFVKQGGKLIFVGKEPYKSLGLMNYKEEDKKVRQSIAAMKQSRPSRVFTVEAPTDDITAWFKNVQHQCGIRPYMQIENPVNCVSQIRQQSGDRDIFFISNCSLEESVTLKASFPESSGTPYLWDAETGERYSVPSAAGKPVTISLPPAASQLIVFDPSAIDAPDYPAQPAETEGEELKKWTVRMEHLNGTVVQRELSELCDFSLDETTRSFSGCLHYEHQTEGDASAYRWLDLGRVNGISELTVNGENLGCRWYGRHLYRLPDSLLRVPKTVSIKVTTTAGNYLKSSPENKIGYNVCNFHQWQSTGMLGPVSLIN
jgi:hypothetical protein